jgi:hypothetical protein
MNFSCPIEESETQASKATSRLYMGAGLVVAGLFLGFLGMQLRNPRAISGSWVLALAVASMGATSLSWSLDTRKTARWMAKESLTIEPTGLKTQGHLHPWSSIRVEIDHGTELLVLDEIGLKIPIDSLDAPSEFRTQVNKASNGRVQP